MFCLKHDAFRCGCDWRKIHIWKERNRWYIQKEREWRTFDTWEQTIIYITAYYGV